MITDEGKVQDVVSALDRETPLERYQKRDDELDTFENEFSNKVGELQNKVENKIEELKDELENELNRLHEKLDALEEKHSEKINSDKKAAEKELEEAQKRCNHESNGEYFPQCRKCGTDMPKPKPPKKKIKHEPGWLEYIKYCATHKK